MARRWRCCSLGASRVVINMRAGLPRSDAFEICSCRYTAQFSSFKLEAMHEHVAPRMGRCDMCKKIRTFYNYNHNRGGKASHENRGRASRRSRQLEMLGAAPSQVDLQRAVPVGPSRAALAVAAHALAAMRALVRAERRRAVLPSEPLVASAPGVGAESVSAARVGAEKPLAARPGPSGVTQARPLVVARTAAVHLAAA